ncbi:hypothetical protein WICMUC_003202 [Wickerhamomyces mucosus]|uniref:Carbohydrate kinase PfkB domain-containing protein n=1 Tax=Wickerhamomyces mucosus TaxID=1378264 RepID=A0A9P8TD20_9ASCO|nr:hypothetical protein WICMUC_003202 [Wickerhamomyces mucosus]
MALSVEKEIRNFGIVPATTAFINGTPKVGLEVDEIKVLASSQNKNKVSRRDIPYTMANGLHGGTTISGTMILSHKAGIKVFATGGLGGVHRGGENTMDISADLEELSRTPVAVVCAGPKSILDIRRTNEYLETKGVFVGTFGDKGTNIPGFYTADSGVKSPYNFSSFESAAKIIHQGNSFQLGSGYLFCIPPPENVALESSLINSVIEQANLDAKERGISGKELTPFLLKRINESTNGQSVNSNIQFVLNNARAASQIAIELSKLECPNTIFTPQLNIPTDLTANGDITLTLDSLVVGSVGLDSLCQLKESSVRLNDSNPSNITTSIGGVGYNVANESFKNGNKSLGFISAVGKDIYGEKITSGIKLAHCFIKRLPDLKTSQYISFHDSQGELIIASSDMKIIEKLPFDYVEKVVRQVSPKALLLDCNLSEDLISKISKIDSDFKLIVEPTSSSKSTRLSDATDVFLITPTVAELKSIYDSFDTKGKFDLDYWFPVVDLLGLDGSFRTRVENLVSRNPQYKEILAKGIVQMGTSLLPYIENIVIKDGANGIFFLSIHENIDVVENSSKAEFSLKSRGRNNSGVLFEHYKVPPFTGEVLNVTGAGDAIAGILLHEISQNVDIFKKKERENVFEIAQNSALKKITN